MCGTAQSLGQLVLFRVLQGTGGGMLAPVGLAMLFRVYPPAERARAARILIVPTALAPAMGPVIGGLLVTDLSWRWVFYVNLPIGIAGVLFGVLFLREQRHDQPGRFDLPGFVLSGASLGTLMYALSESPARGWASPWIIGAAVTGVVLSGALVRAELAAGQPMLDLGLHHVGGTVRPSATAYHAAFLTAAGVALAAAFWATAINDADAAPTMWPGASREPSVTRSSRWR